MKLAIMQPYFFPYIGYFQLIGAVDTFLIYDDVNYIKQGWINRNRILVNGKEYLITLRLESASSFKHINEINIFNNKGKILKTISQAYVKAPFSKPTMMLIKKIFNFEEENLSRFLIMSLEEILKYLNIQTHILISSKVLKDNLLRGQDKVIHLCKILGASEYLNAIGGQSLYERDAFQKEKIKLHFIKGTDIKYKQFDNDFIPWLSMIDVMMFNSIDKIQDMLNQYELI